MSETTKIDTPPRVSKLATPKKLNREQKKVVEKLINSRYQIMRNVVFSTTTPNQVETTGKFFYHGEKSENPGRDVPKDLRDAYAAAVRACNTHDKLVDKYDEQNEKSAREFNETKSALLNRLSREKEASVARLILEDAGDEVRQYLDDLGGLDTIMGDLKKLGLTPEKAKQLMLTAGN